MLVNDFGALDVDAALIAANDGRTLALSNGCVCCSIGDDFGDALNRLAASGPEHVIVEASGVADPWRIAQLALIEPGFALEPLTVLVDAASFAAGLADRWIGDTLRGQLAHAELVVLNKTDIATAGELAGARAAIAALRPEARLLETRDGVVPAEALRFPAAGMRGRRLHADAPHPFRAVLWTPTAPMDATLLRSVLGALPGAVLRIKGVVRLGEERRLLQYATARWAFTPAPAGLGEGLVIIGTPDMPDVAALLVPCCRS